MYVDHSLLASEIESQKSTAKLAGGLAQLGVVGVAIIAAVALFSAVMAPFSLAFWPIFWGATYLAEAVTLPEGYGIFEFFLGAAFLIVLAVLYVAVPMFLMGMTRAVILMFRHSLRLSKLQTFLFLVVEVGTLAAANFAINYKFLILLILEKLDWSPWSSATLEQVAVIISIVFAGAYLFLGVAFTDDAE